MLKKIFYMFFIILTFTLMTACSDKTEGEKQGDNNKKSELKVAYPAQPPSLDPHVSNVIATTDIMAHVYETLITVDEDYGIEPMLAESFEQSEDGKTVVFKLREGVLFHNGEELVAEDVVASMDRWKESVGSRGQFDDALFEVEDKYMVKLTLPEPLSTAFVTMSYIGASFAAIMPKEVIESAGDAGVREYIGTGPYQFVEWKQDQHVHLEEFADYQARTEEASGFAGKKEALVSDLYFIFTPDTSTQVAGIRSGEYDVAFGVPYDVGEQLSEESNLENTSFPNAFIAIHFNKKNGLFTDVKARRAIALALDINEIMLAPFASEDYYALNNNLMMTHQKGQWDSGVGKDTYNQRDVDEAKRLLEEAGYNGEEITFIVTRDYEEHYNAAVVVQEQLEKIGMNIKLEVYDWPTLSDKRENNQAFDMFMMGNVAVPEPTANVYLMSDYGGWTDSTELTEIIRTFRSKPTLEEAKEVYDELQAWFYDYLPIIKVGDYDKIVTLNKAVKNYAEQNKNHRIMLWNVEKE